MSIVLADYAERDGLVAEILVDGKEVAAVNADLGVGRETIEFPGAVRNEGAVVRVVPVSVLLHGIAEALKQLRPDSH
ncbi:MAG: hypothetical protein IT190_02435 [Microbacteriaceae bacterium]|nr:hypothetical protein [Microbacteriaceae bacterium]